MKKLISLAFFLFLAGCDTIAEEDLNGDLVSVRYEVTGNAMQAIIEYIDEDNKVKGTGVENIPWALDIERAVGDQIYLSAWSTETGGGAIQIKVLVGGVEFRTQRDEVGIRTRISGNAY